MKFADVMETIFKLGYLTLPEECTLEEASVQVARNPHARGIYVVDDKEKIQGYLSLGVLIRHIMSSRHKPHFHVRSLLSIITAKKVSDLMEKDVIVARENDTIESVVDMMVERNIKQVPVVNGEGRILANVSILDLWRIMEE